MGAGDTRHDGELTVPRPLWFLAECCYAYVFFSAPMIKSANVFRRYT
jgi:hypothetical protein